MDTPLHRDCSNLVTNMKTFRAAARQDKSAEPPGAGESAAPGWFPAGPRRPALQSSPKPSQPTKLLTHTTQVCHDLSCLPQGLRGPSYRSSSQLAATLRLHLGSRLRLGGDVGSLVVGQCVARTLSKDNAMVTVGIQSLFYSSRRTEFSWSREKTRHGKGNADV